MSNTFSRRGFLGSIATTGAAAAVPGVLSSTTALAATPVVMANFPIAVPHPTAGGPVQIVSGARLTPAEVEQIQSAGKNVNIRVCRDHNEFRERAAEAEVLFGFPDKQVIANARNAKWIQVWAAGLDEVAEDVFHHPAVLTNMQRVFTPVIAESAIGMLLALTRGYVQTWFPNTQAHRWHGGRHAPLDDLYQKTAGIVGMGGMGSDIARRLHYGFGMKVLATDAKPLPKPDFVHELHDPGWLMEMVPQVDVLMSAAPFTKETAKMFNAEVFDKMKRTAYFINTSRGGLVDQPALVRALHEGKIRGAGLDVATPEPLPPNDPFWDAPNVILTGHSSGGAPIRQVRLIALVTENVRRYTNGLPLLNVCDKVRRY